MRTTHRALRTSVIAATTAAAIGLGGITASSTFAGTGAPTATASAVQHGSKHGDKRGYVKTVKLAAKGHSAKVYKLGKNSYRADIVYAGKKVAALHARGKTATGNLNGLHVKLTRSGQVTSWVDRAKPAPKPKPKPKPSASRTFFAPPPHARPQRSEDRGNSPVTRTLLLVAPAVIAAAFGAANASGSATGRGGGGGGGRG
ncbi:hypothetical protein [Streptomyces boluensis]|uniref:Secreted protein n=1 Tax=Streptomyces boluensis TaxID=1775135 RepID=A0A964UT88_9ACTN|nr:hypothetical protein [Streptomyces boluensis]NBE54911.1 hypothetical protein [Streptomyces boluensis]